MEALIWIVIILAVAGVSLAEQNRRKEEAIRKIHQYVTKYVAQYGGTSIKITLVNDKDGDTMTFSVSYRDRHDTYRYTRFKIKIGGIFSANGDLYWTHDPAIAATPVSSSKLQVIDNLVAETERLRSQLADTTSAKSNVASSKEQIISDLSAQNEQLQAELERLRQQLSTN
jgi:hypothetical protein